MGARRAGAHADNRIQARSRPRAALEAAAAQTLRHVRSLHDLHPGRGQGQGELDPAHGEAGEAERRGSWRDAFPAKDTQEDSGTAVRILAQAQAMDDPAEKMRVRRRRLRHIRQQVQWAVVTSAKGHPTHHFLPSVHMNV